MSTQKPRRMDRRTAEQLLEVGSMGIHDDHPPLAALLTAAAVPGRPDELASEQASVAAFRTARLTPVPRPRRLAVVKTAVMKVLTVKAVAVLAATTAGGVAVAAGTGTLPSPLAQPAPAATSGLSAAPPTAEQSRAEYNRGDGSNNSKRPKASNSPSASKGPSPALIGLCHAYRAGEKARHDKALDNPAFTILITTAGGKDKVARFCQALLATPTPADSDAQQSGNRGEDHSRGAPHGRTRNENDDDGPAYRATAEPSATPDR